MISRCLLSLTLLLGAATPARAQEPPAPEPVLGPSPETLVPPQLAERERARTRRCVPLLGRLAALDEALAPLAARGARLRALDEAIALEDSARVTPLSAGDPLEQAVRAWFVEDAELATRLVESGDSTLLARRNEARDRIGEQIFQELATLAASGEERIAAEDLPDSVSECDDVLLVRGAVLEACAAEPAGNPVCEDARSTEPRGRYTFVEAAEDVWDVEQMRPWTEPGPLGRSPDGGVAGARTAVLARRGNLRAVVSLEPLIRERAAVGEEQAARFDANLDSLGFSFQDSVFVMAPALMVRLDFTEPLGGETHYLLHFGDMADPEADLVGSAEVPGGGPLQTFFVTPARILVRLAAGEAMSLTAVRVDESGSGEADAVYSLPLTPVGQARSVSALLSYMAGGQLRDDLAGLVAPAGPGGR